MNTLMPKDNESLKILAERAAHFAKNRIIAPENKGEMSYIKFRLSENDYYGIPYHYGKEVILLDKITKVPFVPEFISGIINWRGKLISILNINKFFKIKNDGDSKYIIIVTGKRMTIGVLAYSMEGSEQYDTNDITSSLTVSNSIKSEYILGLHKSRIAIINMDAVLSDIETYIGGLQK